MRFTICTIAALAAVTSVVSGCGSDAAGPSNGPGGSQRTATFAIDSALGLGTSRIEIHLFPGELVAREAHVEADDLEEKIVSAVTAIDPGQGIITLDLGGLTLTYGAGTRFRTDAESNATRAAWEAAVQSELSAGRHPLIEARRNPPAAPQAPDDASFTAADLRLKTGAGDPTIELYMDGDNLESASGTSAVLRVLGLVIEVNDRTSLVDDTAGGAAGSVEFGMGVTSVDAAAGTLTLANGTVVRVTSSTAISTAGDLLTLESTANAVGAGQPVRAEGRGTVESAGPPAVINAASLKIEVDD